MRIPQLFAALAVLLLPFLSVLSRAKPLSVGCHKLWSQMDR